MAPPETMPEIELSKQGAGAGGAPPSTPQKVAQGTCSIVGFILATFCLVVGLMVLIIPASFLEFGEVQVAATGTTANCTAILPQPPVLSAPMPPGHAAFVAAWDAYVAGKLSSAEGVRSGCEPLRFPAANASQYKGVALIWHGFSSCPQEMATMGPPLAAHGWDVVIPLMPGHGNALRYEPDAPNFLWGWLLLGFSLFGLAIMGCARACPIAQLCCPCECCSGSDDKACCSQKARVRCIGTTCCLLTILTILSIVAIVIAVVGTGDAVFCLSLSFEDGVGPGCGGFSEYNDNMPSTAAGYTVEFDAMAEIVRLAPGEKVLMGLSGGGGAALYTGMTHTNADGTALFSKQLLVAPYIDVGTIGPILGPIDSMGLGEVKVDFGQSCRSRREMGKRGYCNYRFNRIAAMRQVARNALADLQMLPGANVEVVLAENDGVVTNVDIHRLADGLDTLATASADRQSSRCVLAHVDSRHSPLSIWNYIHEIGDEDLPWVPELVCQFTAFLDAGTPIPVTGTGSTNGGYDVCASPCSGASMAPCSYDCNADAYITCGAL